MCLLLMHCSRDVACAVKTILDQCVSPFGLTEINGRFFKSFFFLLVRSADYSKATNMLVVTGIYELRFIIDQLTRRLILPSSLSYSSKLHGEMLRTR